MMGHRSEFGPARLLASWTDDSDPADRLAPDYRAWVESANLDWIVAEYVRTVDAIPLHSSNLVRAFALASIGRAQHGDAFDQAFDRY